MSHVRITTFSSLLFWIIYPCVFSFIKFSGKKLVHFMLLCPLGYFDNIWHRYISHWLDVSHWTIFCFYICRVNSNIGVWLRDLPFLLMTVFFTWNGSSTVQICIYKLKCGNGEISRRVAVSGHKGNRQSCRGGKSEFVSTFLTLKEKILLPWEGFFLFLE